ncbi:MAG: YfhL family 4Fe-4S dicluster ferredoxin [Deltaproteobacteria bacterium]|nr:YfhL family 4Fe-4S dicluster ferredoxin [Deltaproteobacteria bacterium]
MALMITEDCVNCAACEPECPNEAISEGEDIFIIDPDLCTECIGAFDESQCAAVCPTDACLPDPDHEEDKDSLLEKYNKIHGA